MNVGAIVGEYNPFHLGHEYLIHKLKDFGCNYIIIVMSGNYVQRGNVAIISKWARAKSALLSGADLVIELPTLFSLSRAENFAMGSIKLLNSLNLVNVLGFGSECGSLRNLQKIAKFLLTEDFSLSLKKYLDQKFTFAQAREKVLINFFKDQNITNIISSPNDILAVEYLKSLNTLKSDIKPMAVKRIGANHKDDFMVENIASASFIRRLIMDKGLGCEVRGLVPDSSFRVMKEEFKNNNGPANVLLGERAVLACLRRMSRDDLSQVFDVSEGLENRLYNAIKKATSIKDLLSYVQTKRYTNSRLNRIILSAFLGITKSYSNMAPNYINVLGFNERGRSILKKAKVSSRLPIVTRFSDVKKLDCYAKKMFDLQLYFDSLYFVFMPSLKPIDFQSAIFLKEGDF